MSFSLEKFLTFTRLLIRNRSLLWRPPKNSIWPTAIKTWSGKIKKKKNSVSYISIRGDEQSFEIKISQNFKQISGVLSPQIFLGCFLRLWDLLLFKAKMQKQNKTKKNHCHQLTKPPLLLERKRGHGSLMFSLMDSLSRSLGQALSGALHCVLWQQSCTLVGGGGGGGWGSCHHQKK